MSVAEWALAATTAIAVLTAFAKGFAWLVNLLLEQAREALQAMKEDRDAWRTRAEDCEEQRRPTSPEVPS